MATLHQTLLLGTERLTTPPASPHPALAVAWAQLDWAGGREAALLEAISLAGIARSAGGLPEVIAERSSAAPAESRPLVSPAAVSVLRQVLAEEWSSLLPEWLELAAARDLLVPPFFLPGLLQRKFTAEQQGWMRKVAGERGAWLGRQNPAWSWIGAERAAAAETGIGLWETGTPEERLAWWRRCRESNPAQARELLEKTWGEEELDFRRQLLEAMAIGLSLADEPWLTRLLKERRKELRVAAQGLLATLPGSGFAQRMRERALRLLKVERGLLGRKIEVQLPVAFDLSWRDDAIEEKPPTGMGEKAFWTLQILSLVPLHFWIEQARIEADRLVDLAAKSGEWVDLLLGAWYRATRIHREPAAAAALFKPVLARPSVWPAGTGPQEIATTLLELCSPAERWKIAAENDNQAWLALPLLGGTPSPGDARAVLQHWAKSLRDGYSPGGSPTAVLAARRLPPTVRDEAARLLARENGLSKPAETFLQALELRAALHASFPS